MQQSGKYYAVFEPNNKVMNKSNELKKLLPWVNYLYHLANTALVVIQLQVNGHLARA